jgi:glycosyltransferase involved in cell wall biosynthesis
MYRVARSIPAAVYHIHDPELIPLAWLLKRTTGASVIYDMHEDYAARVGLEGRLLRVLERWCFRWVDHVIVVDDQLACRLKRDSVACTKIPNYMRIGTYNRRHDARASRRKNTSGPQQPLRLVHSGYQSEKRGLFAMIELADLLGSSEVSLVLAGRCNYPEDRAKAEEIVKRSPMMGDVHFVGWDSFLPHEQIIDRYSQADVGLVMWHRDPNHTRIPTKMYEYLHYGLPIICSNFPLWRSFIERHGCGAVVPPGDAEAAAKVLRRWRAEPSRYQTCARAAQQAASQFRWRRVAPILRTVYQHAVQR